MYNDVCNCYAIDSLHTLMHRLSARGLKTENEGIRGVASKRQKIKNRRRDTEKYT